MIVANAYAKQSPKFSSAGCGPSRDCRKAPPATDRQRTLKLDRAFQPCVVEDGHELFPNGIFEFNITRLLEWVDAHTERFPVELVLVAGISELGGDRLDQTSVRAADLSRPILMAEIAPGLYNLIDGHHRLARARREDVASIPAQRVQCPEHMAFLTSFRAYQAYVEYWNSKVKEMTRSLVSGAYRTSITDT